jgi:hypothetical protein
MYIMSTSNQHLISRSLAHSMLHRIGEYEVKRAVNLGLLRSSVNTIVFLIRIS